MAGILDRFRDPEKVRQQEIARHEVEEQKRREEHAARIREEEIRARSEWTYNEFTDEMRGTTRSVAQLVSENSVDFAFPYSGGCQALIIVRREGHQREVLFSVTNGQFDHDIDGYTLNTKADTSSIQTWRATEPDQGGATIMFLTNPADFIRSLENASRFIVEAEFYQHGRAQFTFNVGGLDRRFR